jgi:hypothetical protein
VPAEPVTPAVPLEPPRADDAPPVPALELLPPDPSPPSLTDGPQANEIVVSSAAPMPTRTLFRKADRTRMDPIDATCRDLTKLVKETAARTDNLAGTARVDAFVAHTTRS